MEGCECASHVKSTFESWELEVSNGNTLPSLSKHVRLLTISYFFCCVCLKLKPIFLIWHEFEEPKFSPACVFFSQDCMLQCLFAIGQLSVGLSTFTSTCMWVLFYWCQLTPTGVWRRDSYAVVATSLVTQAGPVNRRSANKSRVMRTDQCLWRRHGAMGEMSAGTLKPHLVPLVTAIASCRLSFPIYVLLAVGRLPKNVHP